MTRKAVTEKIREMLKALQGLSSRKAGNSATKNYSTNQLVENEIKWRLLNSEVSPN